MGAGPGQDGPGGFDLPKRPKFSWDMKSAPWTDGKGDQEEFSRSATLWEAFHDKLPDSNSNKVPKTLCGIVLQSNLFGRAKDLCKKVPDIEIQSENGVAAIVKVIHKRDLLTAVSNVYHDFLTLLDTKRGNSETFRNFESGFAAKVSKFNSHGKSCEIAESLTAFMLLANAGVDSNQRISVLAAATPHETQFTGESTTDDFLKAVSYDTVASVLRQCDKMRGSESTLTQQIAVPAVHANAAASTRPTNRFRQTLTPAQLADLKSKSQCRKCKMFGHWKSDHNLDGSLKPGVSSKAAPASNRQSLQRSVTFNLVTVPSTHSISTREFIGPLCDDGAPYSGLGHSELDMLLSVLLPEWDGVLDPIPDSLASRPFWQYGVGTHSSQAMPIIGSISFNAESDDGINVSIRHLVIEGSSQWIIGRNVTTHCDIIHSNGNYLRMKNGSTITLHDHDMHSYVPYTAFCKTKLDYTAETMLFCATASIPSIQSARPWVELKHVIDKVHSHVCGHASFSDMKVLLQRNGLWSDEAMKYLARVIETCAGCSHTSDPQNARKVSIRSLNRSFNQVVCIDHLHLSDMRVCHVMDATTRYSVGSVVPDVGIDNAILTLEAHWISPFWAPESIQCDQAFDNSKFKSYLSIYDISPRPIPARRHNKNVLESKHRILRDMFLRLSAHSPEISESLIVQQTFRIANDLYGNDVLSSSELAKGYTRPINKGVRPKILPEEIVTAHEALIAKRKLTLILRSRSTLDTPVSVGDMVQVFIKRDHEKRGKWTSPKLVLSYDKSSGIVTVPGTSGHTIKAAIEDVRLAITNSDLATSIQEAMDTLTLVVDNAIDDTITEKTINLEERNDEHAKDWASDSDEDGNGGLTPLPATGDSVEVYWPLDKAFYPAVISSVAPDTEHRVVHYHDGEVETLDTSQETWLYSKNDTLSASVTELTSNSEETLSTFKNRFGFKDFLMYQAEGLPSYILWNAYNAKEEKFKQTVQEVHVTVVPKNANIITSHVIYKVKPNDDGSLKMKARIAPHGNKDKDRSDLKTDSATCPPTGIRVLLSIATFMKWPITKIDFTSAYLQTGDARRDVYVVPPRECEDRSKYWLLKAAAYGLVNAGAKWQEHADALLQSLGLFQLKFVPQVFYSMCSSGLNVLAVKVVDDILFTGDRDKSIV